MIDRLAGDLCRADGLGPRQAALDILRDERSGRRRQGDHGRIDTLAQAPYLQVIRTEVIAPLGYAMSFIHYDEAYVHHIKV